MNITCRLLSKSEFPEALAIRITVFVDEQKVPLEIEQDHHDTTALHFGAFDQDKMVGTGRLVLEDGAKAKLGRFAVLKQYRGFGIGRTLVETIINHCRNEGLEEIYLGSQLYAIPFYEKFGFVVEGTVFDDGGIPHRIMRMQLEKHPQQT